MQNALLVLQIIADIFLRANKNKPYFQRCLFKAFFSCKMLAYEFDVLASKHRP